MCNGMPPAVSGSMRLLSAVLLALCRRVQFVVLSPVFRSFFGVLLGPVLLVCALQGQDASRPLAGHAAAAAARRHEAMAASRIRGTEHAAARLAAARAQQQTMLQQRAGRPDAVPLSTRWQPVGPSQVATGSYGLITGRVTSIAIDPADGTANTVYVGTSGGGVWKSTNAAASQLAVRFEPLTDTLPAFAPGTGALPSLSVGAMSVQPGGTGVVLAATGDPNDALDSYGGSGVLRSADGGVTWALATGTSDGVGSAGFFGEGFAGFAWSTSAANVVVAAVSSAAEASLTGSSRHSGGVRGLFYSTDAGATWHTSTLMDGGVVLQSSATDFSAFEGNAATAVVWNPVRQRFYAAVRFHGFYESADGVTFTRLVNQPGAALSAAACPSNAGAAGSAGCPSFERRWRRNRSPATCSRSLPMVETRIRDCGRMCARRGATAAVVRWHGPTA